MTQNGGSAFSKILQSFELFPRKHVNDINEFIIKIQTILRRRLLTLLEQQHGIKAYFVIDMEYDNPKEPERTFHAFLNTRNLVLRSPAELDHFIEQLKIEVLTRNERFIRDKSGLVIHSILKATANVQEYNPLEGSSYLPLPKFLANKHAIVNVNNTDNRCFVYAILAALHPQAQNGNRSYLYEQYFEPDHLANLHYRISPNDIPAIEEQLNIHHNNSIALNVFTFFDDNGKLRAPLYVSPHQNREKIIDLLYWKTARHTHYAWIRNFSSFMHDLTKQRGTTSWCRRCLGHFGRESTLQNHQQFCRGDNLLEPIVTMPQPKYHDRRGNPIPPQLEFKNIKYQMKCPFVFVADCEAFYKENE